MKPQATRETLEALAEAADHYMRICNEHGSSSQQAMNADIALGDRVRAYRAEATPLRTRAEVDKDIVAATRQHIQALDAMSKAEKDRIDHGRTWDKIRSLCAEPTREPEAQ